MSERPTTDQMETAMFVLLWLHETTDNGSDRDRVAFVRALLDDRIEEAEL